MPFDIGCVYSSKMPLFLEKANFILIHGIQPRPILVDSTYSVTVFTSLQNAIFQLVQLSVLLLLTEDIQLNVLQSSCGK